MKKRIQSSTHFFKLVVSRKGIAITFGSEELESPNQVV
jgi:hypothetical protein